ncbi:MAG: hypothetical protein WC860_08605 [Candidatus Margulisiibacteriota bacterium]|jgi:hypothetical protein
MEVVKTHSLDTTVQSSKSNLNHIILEPQQASLPSDVPPVQRPPVNQAVIPVIFSGSQNEPSSRSIIAAVEGGYAQVSPDCFSERAKKALAAKDLETKQEIVFGALKQSKVSSSVKKKGPAQQFFMFILSLVGLRSLFFPTLSDKINSLFKNASKLYGQLEKKARKSTLMESEHGAINQKLDTLNILINKLRGLFELAGNYQMLEDDLIKLIWEDVATNEDREKLRSQLVGKKINPLHLLSIIPADVIKIKDFDQYITNVLQVKIGEPLYKPLRDSGYMVKDPLNAEFIEADLNGTAPILPKMFTELFIQKLVDLHLNLKPRVN